MRSFDQRERDREIILSEHYALARRRSLEHRRADTAVLLAFMELCRTLDEAAERIEAALKDRR